LDQQPSFPTLFHSQVAGDIIQSRNPPNHHNWHFLHILAAYQVEGPASGNLGFHQDGSFLCLKNIDL